MSVKAPQYALSALRRLEARGFEAYFVGGCMRDALLGKRPHDWDICTSARPEAVMAAFPRSYPTGIRHGTVTVVWQGRSLEITSFRTDGAYSDHRRPDEVSFIDNLEGDLERRDFRMNAIAMSSGGEIFDPFGGAEDIRRRRIGCVGEPDRRFSEDALRILRALRFSAELGFEIESETMASIERNASLIGRVSVERISAELTRALLSPRPEKTALMLRLCGFLPETGAESDIRLRRISRLRKKKDLRFAALCAVLGSLGAIASAKDFLQRLRLDGETVKNASKGAALALDALPVTALDWKRLFAANGQPACDCAAAALFALKGPGAAEPYRALLKSGDCMSLSSLAVSGRDLESLGYSGAETGRALKALLEHVLVNPRDNERELLLRLARERRM